MSVRRSAIVLAPDFRSGPKKMGSRGKHEKSLGMKNLFLSIWLSSANRAMGAARGAALANARRHSAAMMAEGTRQAIRFWTAAVAEPARTTRKRKRRI